MNYVSHIVDFVEFTDGASTDKIEEKYYATSEEKTIDEIKELDATDWFDTPFEAGHNAINRYLWNYEIITLDTEKTIITEPVLISTQAKSIDAMVEFSKATNSTDEEDLGTLPTITVTEEEEWALDNDQGWCYDGFGNIEYASPNKNNPILWNYTIIGYDDKTTQHKIGPRILSRIGDSPRTLSLDNDHDTVVFNNAGEMISSVYPTVKPTCHWGNEERALQIVTHVSQLGNTPEEQAKEHILLTPDKQWSEGSHFLIPNDRKTFSIKGFPISGSDGNDVMDGTFTFEWKEGTTVYDKKVFTIKKLISTKDYDLLIDQVVYNNTSVGGTFGVKVLKKSEAGTEELTASDGEIELFKDGTKVTTSWAAMAYTTTSTKMEFAIKTNAGKTNEIVWDKEVVEFVKDGIEATTHSYYMATTTETAPDDSDSGWCEDALPTGTAAHGPLRPYLWTYEKTTYSREKDEYTTPVTLLSREPRAIKTLTEFYIINTGDTPNHPRLDSNGNGLTVSGSLKNTSEAIAAIWTNTTYKWSTTPGTPTAEQSLWNAELIEYQSTDGEGKNLFQVIAPAKIGYIGRDGIDSYALSLDNDTDTVVFDNDNNPVSDYPIIVRATKHIGHTPDTTTGVIEVSLSSDKTWQLLTSDELPRTPSAALGYYYYSTSSTSSVATLKIHQFPKEGTYANFTFSWKNQSGGSTVYDESTFTLKRVTSIVDYDIIIAKTVINSSQGAGEFEVQVLKKDANGTSTLSKPDSNIKLYKKVGDAAEVEIATAGTGENAKWQTQTYAKDQTTNIKYILKSTDTTPFTWDEETVEFTRDGSSLICITPDQKLLKKTRAQWTALIQKSLSNLVVSNVSNLRIGNSVYFIGTVDDSYSDTDGKHKTQVTVYGTITSIDTTNKKLTITIESVVFGAEKGSDASVNFQNLWNVFNEEKNNQRNQGLVPLGKGALADGTEYDRIGINATLIRTGALKVGSSDTPSANKFYADMENGSAVYLAGWTVTNSSITAGNIGADTSFHMYSNEYGATGQIGNKKIEGTTSSGNPGWKLAVGSKFGVDAIGGIYASSGVIGGWDISPKTLRGVYFENMNNVDKARAKFMAINTDPKMNLAGIPAAFALIDYPWNKEKEEWDTSNGEVTFLLTYDGYIRTSHGEIGSWELDRRTLTGDMKFTINSGEDKDKSRTRRAIVSCNFCDSDGYYDANQTIFAVGVTAPYSGSLTNSVTWNFPFKVTADGSLYSTRGSIASFEITDNYLLGALQDPEDNTSRIVGLSTSPVDEYVLWVGEQDGNGSSIAYGTNAQLTIAPDGQLFAQHGEINSLTTSTLTCQRAIYFQTSTTRINTDSDHALVLSGNVIKFKIGTQQVLTLSPLNKEKIYYHVKSFDYTTENYTTTSGANFKLVLNESPTEAASVTIFIANNRKDKIVNTEHTLNIEIGKTVYEFNVPDSKLQSHWANVDYLGFSVDSADSAAAHSTANRNAKNNIHLDKTWKTSGTGAFLNNREDGSEKYFYHIEKDSGWQLLPPSGETVNLGTPTQGFDYIYGKNIVNADRISDSRLKKNISTLNDNYEQFFDLMQPVKYKYIDGDSNRYHTGFIAQQLVEALGQSELTTQDCAAVCLQQDGGQEEFWYLRRDEFVALNTWQIQKLKPRVTQLEEELLILKTRIQELENKI